MPLIQINNCCKLLKFRCCSPNKRTSPMINHIISYPCQFQACNKSQYCLGPSVTGPHRKRCLNIYHGLHCIRTDQWKGISILTMVNIEIRTSRTMQGRINKEMKFNISHGWYWNKSTWNSGWTRTWIPILSMVDIEIRASRTLQESKISSRIHPWQKALRPTLYLQA